MPELPSFLKKWKTAPKKALAEPTMGALCPPVQETPSLSKTPDTTSKQFALMGNPSAGKSAMFSQMTGVNVIVSNIPQTTVMVQKGLSQVNGHNLFIYDLPGVYSITAVTEDEAATKEFLLGTSLDAVIDIVDATRLERNLYLTLQMLELGLPVVVSLNQVDLLKTLDLDIDVAGLEKELGAQVVPTIATQGEGVHATLETAYHYAERPSKRAPRQVSYDDHVERALAAIILLLPETGIPKRGFAARLLEGDKDFESRVDEHTLARVKEFRDEVERAHGEDVAITIARGRYSTADLIASAVLVRKVHKPTLAEKFGDMATRPRTGYPLLVGLIGGMLALIFFVGGYLSDLISAFFEGIVFPPVFGIVDAHVANVFITSAVHSTLLALAAALSIAVPYIMVFFIFLAILEDVGYLPRVAVLLDRQAHVLGLRGRSIVPLLFGYGCSVPAIMATRALPTRKERIITTALITMIPCSARTAIILGVAATYAGIQYRACHLPHLLRARHRLWEAAAINCAGKDGGARARNSAYQEAGARPDPEEDVAADEGVSLHRRAPAYYREYRVRMAGCNRSESIHRGADDADHRRYFGTPLLHGHLSHLRGAEKGDGRGNACHRVGNVHI